MILIPYLNYLPDVIPYISMPAFYNIGLYIVLMTMSINISWLATCKFMSRIHFVITNWFSWHFLVGWRKARVQRFRGWKKVWLLRLRQRFGRGTGKRHFAKKSKCSLVRIIYVVIWFEYLWVHKMIPIMAKCNGFT